MKIVFMGTPQFAVPILDMLYKKHDVLLVVTQPDKPVGRKNTLTPSPVKQCAMAHGLPVFQPESLKKDYQPILDLNPDYLITAAYGQMLPQDLLDRMKAINVHGSILPKYRGGAPIQYALFDGQKETGVTIMYMAYKMDSGDIIKQATIPIDDDDNYQSLSIKLSHLGTQLLEGVLNDLIQGKVVSIPQDESKVTYAKTLKKEDEYLHFNQPSQVIIQRIKGLAPDPGASLFINGVTLKVFKAIKSDIIEDNLPPGCILSDKKKLIVKTVDGAVELIEIQAPGKKRMEAKDFLNGQNIFKKGDMFIEGMNQNV